MEWLAACFARPTQPCPLIAVKRVPMGSVSQGMVLGPSAVVTAADDLDLPGHELMLHGMRLSALSIALYVQQEGLLIRSSCGVSGHGVPKWEVLA